MPRFDRLVDTFSSRRRTSCVSQQHRCMPLPRWTQPSSRNTRKQDLSPVSRQPRLFCSIACRILTLCLCSGTGTSWKEERARSDGPQLEC